MSNNNAPVCPVVQEATSERELKIKKHLEQVRTLMGNRIMPDSRSTNEQLQDLMNIANQVGLYDAADVIKGLLKK